MYLESPPNQCLVSRIQPLKPSLPNKGAKRRPMGSNAPELRPPLQNSTEVSVVILEPYAHKGA